MSRRKKSRAPLTRPKTRRELAAAKKAVNITARIFREMGSPFGRSEADVAGEIRRRAKALGAGLSFPPIVASGGNAGYVHHRPCGKIVRDDETVIFDIGFKVGGQCSDVTRMHIPDDARSRKIYRDMVFIQRKCIAMARPGTTLKAINDEFRRLMKRKGYRVKHSIGHGVGGRVHGRVKGPLKPGVVITIEPGAYFRKRRGCRVEDMVLVTRGRPAVLTAGIKPRL
jgi:Xaa-Pro aminopeptidase